MSHNPPPIEVGAEPDPFDAAQASLDRLRDGLVECIALIDAELAGEEEPVPAWLAATGHYS